MALTPSAGVNAVQTLTLGGTPTGGTYTLTLYGYTTTPLAYNATGATIQAALQLLANIGPNNVLVSPAGSGTTFTITFQNGMGGQNVPTLTATSSLTGTNPTISVVTSTTGVGVYTSATGGTLTLDNTGTNNVFRLNDLEGIALGGGILNILGNSALASSETVGTITLLAGNSTILTNAGTSGTIVLTGGNFFRNPGAALNSRVDRVRTKP